MKDARTTSAALTSSGTLHHCERPILNDLGWSDWGTPEAVERTFAAMGCQPPWRGAALAIG